MKVYALDLSDPTINPTAQASDINTLFSTLFFLIRLVAFAVFVGAGLYGAFLIIIARENSDQVAKGQKILTYAVVGLILVVLSLIFTKVIGYVFKLNFNF